MAEAALFEPDGPSVFVPTAAAVGPWDRGSLHGAAVAALVAGRFAAPDLTLARLTIELLAPVALAPLTFALSKPSGGSRVQRRHATLTCDGRTVATASSVAVRRAELQLPSKALAHVSPFDPAAAPALLEPNRAPEKLVGWPSFDSRGIVFEWMRVEGDPRPHQWAGLAVPVVAGTEIHGIEVAAMAADYAQTAVNWQLPYESWSFRNAELTIHLAREPVGTWIGIRSEAVVQPVGAGFNAADLFDADGRVARSASTLVVEPRTA